jgi:hypothetical protein
MTDINKSPNWLHIQILYLRIDRGTGYILLIYTMTSAGFCGLQEENPVFFSLEKIINSFFTLSVFHCINVNIIIHLKLIMVSFSFLVSSSSSIFTGGFIHTYSVYATGYETGSEFFIIIYLIIFLEKIKFTHF